MARAFERTGQALARFLSREDPTYVPLATVAPDKLAAALRPCDVLLVEGSTRISTAIKYLTQSTWSHAALYLGELAAPRGRADDATLIEADLVEGIRLVPLRTYADRNTRICRPVGLAPMHQQAIAVEALAHLGDRYDLKNVLDLARYLLPTPPVPTRWRRRLIALGSGEPTRAICSTFIARLFQSVRYPILPTVERERWGDPDCNSCYDEILHIRHYSLFAPRDFDISPYFEVVKPDATAGFDYRALRWSDRTADGAECVAALDAEAGR
jgi:hypothetical protein